MMGRTNLMLVCVALLAFASTLPGQATTRSSSQPATAPEETPERKAQIDKMIERQVAQDPYFFGDREFARLKSPYAVQQLLVKMNDKDRKVRMQASRALGFMRDHAATDALLKMLAVEDKQEKFAATYALGHLGDKRATALLLKMFGDGSLSANTRGGIADALGLIGDKESVPALKEAAKNKDDYLRVCSIRALMAMGDEDGIAAAIDILKSDLPWGLKIMIVAESRKHPDARFKEHLVSLLKDKTPIANEAAAAIKTIDAMPATSSAPASQPAK